MQSFQTLQQLKLIVHNDSYWIENNQDRCTRPMLCIWFKIKEDEVQEIKTKMA